MALPSSGTWLPSIRIASSPESASVSVDRFTSPSASTSALPVSRAMISPISAARSTTSAAARRRIAARS
jgi:hypothetical protein